MAKAKEPYLAKGWFVPMTDADFDNCSGIFFVNEIVMDDIGSLSIIRYGATLLRKDIAPSKHVYFKQIGSGGMTVEKIATYPSQIFEVEYMEQLAPGIPSNVTNSRCINRKGYTLQDYSRDYFASDKIRKSVKGKTV